METLWFKRLADMLQWPELAHLHLPQWGWLGLCAATTVLLALWSLRRHQLSWRHGLVMIASAMAAGVLGGHLVAVAFKPHLLLAQPWRLVILFKSGVSSLGVYAGAMVGVGLWAWLRKQPLQAYCDATAPSLLLGAGMARLGCLMHGCDFGTVTTAALPWAMRYPQDSPAFRFLTRHQMIDPFRAVGLPMHPFALYEALPVMLAAAVMLKWPKLTGQAPGQRAAAAGAIYCAVRAVAEHFRGDAVDLLAGVSLLQVLCALAAAGFAALWYHLNQPQTAPKLEICHA